MTAFRKTDVGIDPTVEAKVRQCIALLLDDHARQGGILKIDDVNRVISRRQLSPNEALEVWDGLRVAGVQVEGLGPQATQLASTEDDSAFDHDLWFTSYTSHKLLTHSEEIQLGRRIIAARAAIDATSGHLDENRRQIVEMGKLARAQLILSNIRLVVYVARRLARLTSLPLEDLIQEGIVGLHRAIERYDPERGFKFATYATWWIDQCISRAIDVTGRTIRVPVHMLEEIRKMRHKRKRLASVLRRAPSPYELAHEVGCDVAKIHLLQRLEHDAKSFETISDEADGFGRIERLRSHVEAPDKVAERLELERIVNNVLRTLDNRSRSILIMRFGLNGQRPKTLEQVGRRFQVTRERIRQIEKRALEKISRGEAGRLLRQYAPDDSEVNQGKQNEPDSDKVDDDV